MREDTTRVIARSAVRRAVVLALALLVVACQPEQVTPSPTPTPAATPARPRFELSTYEYALQTKGKIRVAVLDASPPLSARTAGKLEGFEPDIAREIARAIWGTNEDPETHIEWISVDASTRVSALTSNQADITLAGLIASDELKRTIDLSDPYLRTGDRLLVKKTNDQIKDLADVATGEQTVCAVRDSPAVGDLRTITNNGAKVLQLDTLEFCLQALTSGAADALTADEATLLGIVSKDQTLRIVAKPYTDDRFAIGMKKTVAGDRTGFAEFVNGALLKIVADRTWSKLYAKHIGALTGETKQIPTD